MIRTDDFEEASKRNSGYVEIDFNIFLSTLVEQMRFLKEKYIRPSESIEFKTIVFGAVIKVRNENLKIALVVEAEMPDWVIRIQVYNKQRNDKDRGPIID